MMIIIIIIIQNTYEIIAPAQFALSHENPRVLIKILGQILYLAIN